MNLYERRYFKKSLGILLAMLPRFEEMQPGLTTQVESFCEDVFRTLNDA